MSKETDAAKLQKAELARQILENPLYQEGFTAIRAAYIEALSNIKKGRHYEMQLKDIHDSLQNLNRIEHVMESYYKAGKVVLNKKRKLFSDRT